LKPGPIGILKEIGPKVNSLGASSSQKKIDLLPKSGITIWRGLKGHIKRGKGEIDKIRLRMKINRPNLIYKKTRNVR